MAEVEALKSTLENWVPGENADHDALVKETLLIHMALVDALRQAVYDEWGHDWKTQPACRRVLGPHYDLLEAQYR